MGGWWSFRSPEEVTAEENKEIEKELSVLICRKFKCKQDFDTLDAVVKSKKNDDLEAEYCKQAMDDLKIRSPAIRNATVSTTNPRTWPLWSASIPNARTRPPD
jgi:hypothetical protein